MGNRGNALKQMSALFRWFRDGSSAPTRRTWFLGCHNVRVGVVLRGQFSSEEPQNSVDCFVEEIHEDAASCATCYHLHHPHPWSSRACDNNGRSTACVCLNLIEIHCIATLAFSLFPKRDAGMEKNCSGRLANLKFVTTLAELPTTGLLTPRGKAIEGYLQLDRSRLPRR
jgi:hypothetical protein